MKDKIKIPLSNDEIQAIQAYTGYEHTGINMISELDYKKLNFVSKAGWKIPKTKIEIDNAIKKFIRIYSAIYKQGKESLAGTLYRGVDIKELNDIEERKKINKILSASVDEDIAKTFLPYQNGAIIMIQSAKNLKQLYIEPYRDEDRRNEGEILLQPFGKITKKRFIGNWNGINYYSFSLEKEELPDISDNDIKILEKECIENFEEYINKINEIDKIGDEFDYLYSQLNITGLNKEDKKFLEEKKDHLFDTFWKLKKELSIYQEKFLKMLKGKCKQKEKEIDYEKQKIMEEEKKRKKEELRIKVEKLQKELQNYEEEIILKLDKNSRNLENILNNNETIAKKLNVTITKYSIGDFKGKIEEIKNELENNNETKELTENRYLELQIKEQKLDNINKLLIGMSKIVDMQNQQQLNEIKLQLNNKIQNMLYELKIKKLQSQKKVLQEEKIGRLAKLFGKEKLQYERIRNIDYKMEYAKIQFEKNNYDDKVENMLENIYEFSLEELQGDFTPEMNQIINSIRKTFSDLPSENIIIEKVQNKLMQKSLIPVCENGRLKKRKIVKVQKENEILISKIEKNKSTTKNKFKSNTLIPAMEMFLNELNQMEKILEEKNIYEKKGIEKVKE